MIFAPREKGMIPLGEMKAENQTNHGRYCQGDQVPHRLLLFKRTMPATISEVRSCKPTTKLKPFSFPTRGISTNPAQNEPDTVPIVLMA